MRWRAYGLVHLAPFSPEAVFRLDDDCLKLPVLRSIQESLVFRTLVNSVRKFEVLVNVVFKDDAAKTRGRAPAESDLILGLPRRHGTSLVFP